jgi:succinoglycan biosynthesis protein ExoM
VPLYSVCIATYQRPTGLLCLLESIEARVLGPDIDLEIIIVDNDPGSSEDLVSTFAATSRFPIRYLTQPEQNISITRNVAVREAAGDFIWFVDDDEVAAPECLSRLASALHEFDADGVFGPVLPEFEGEQPEWIQTSPAFNRPIGVTGVVSQGYRTSNTLVRSEILKESEGPFDPAYGVSGGSDSMLFRTLAREGRHFIDSADAFVVETIPANRANWEWMSGRIRRQGQNYARQTIALSGGALSPPVLSLSGKALIQIVSSASLSLLYWRNQPQRRRWLLRLWSNLGKLEGVGGAVSVRTP